MPRESVFAKRSTTAFGILSLVLPLHAEQQSRGQIEASLRVRPVALITQATHATIRRANLQTAVPTYKGDLVFPGDTLLATDIPITVAFCPTSSALSFVGGEIKVERTRVSPSSEARQTAATRLSYCRLPGIRPGGQRGLETAADRIQTSSTAGMVGQASVKPPLIPEQQERLEAMSAAVKKEPQQIPAALAFAIALEEAGDYNGSLQQYEAVSKLAPEARWIPDEVRQVAAQRERVEAGNGRVIAVVVGISEYQSLPSDNQLQFADRDAEDFYNYLISPRGAARPANVALLQNEKARLADIKVALGYAFAQASPSDTVVVFIAGHGIAQDQRPNSGAYILAYDSNPENLPDTALHMEEMQGLTDGKLRPRQVRLFIDVCHSGLIGTIQNHRFNLFMTEFLNNDRPVTQVFGLMASKQKELSYECTNLEHGAFTYFLLKGLDARAGESVDRKSDRITVDSLTYYVQQAVRLATDAKQNPEQRGNAPDRLELADKNAEGLGGVGDPARQSANVEACESSRGRRARGGSGSLPVPPSQALRSDAYSDALSRGLILPGVPGSAYDLLRDLQTTLSSVDYQIARNRLLAALQNAGQEIVLRYLRGEAVAMTVDDFMRGESYFAAASALLMGGDSFVESRRLFCGGRALIFQHKLPEAIGILEEAIRLDAFGAYSYNALGIAFLEAADYERAILAFQDATRLAPYWAYARHNLALTLTQQGQYAPAIAAYRAAMMLGPQYFYIPYNLGLLYERLNRPEEARQAWQDCLRVAPRLARAWNAIGLSYFLERRFGKAEEAYQNALQYADNRTDLLTIRHDLAVLRNDRRQFDDAVRLWRLNLAERPGDLPSLVGLSDAYASRGQTKEALETLSILVKEKPDYSGARLQYARMLAKSGRGQEAESELAVVLRVSPDSADANELLGDLRAVAASSNVAWQTEVLKLYRTALKHAASGDQRSRIRQKIGALESK